jgi:hypothetical protein
VNRELAVVIVALTLVVLCFGLALAVALMWDHLPVKQP